MKTKTIPVWLLTGFLGSGKTSLLLNWLHDSALARAAVVINEIGEVGMDNTLVASLVDSASVLTGNCVCCSGLQGLEDTLSDLWWDRLYRRRPNFDSVIIETTGLADPHAIQNSFRQHPFLRERYVLQPILVTLSTTQGSLLLESSCEATAQVDAADVLILTKTDMADPVDLIERLVLINSRARILQSAHAELKWGDVFDADHSLSKISEKELISSVGTKTHSHEYQTDFVPTKEFEDESAIHTQLALLLSNDLVRLKGIVSLKNQKMCIVQWSWLDKTFTITTHEGLSPDQWGVTCIRTNQNH